MRLGELLVQDGLVTAEEVESALSRQALYGARFGTNLVESGAISMEDLAHALGRQHQKPAVLASHYDQIDNTLTAKLTPDLAAMWRAIPLGWTGPESSLVAIATKDPFDNEVRCELQNIFDAEIVDAIAPEMRIYYWLELVYKIDRLNRFKRIARRPSTALPIPDDSAQGDAEEAAYARTETRVYVQTLGDAEPSEPVGQLARIAVKRISLRSGEHDLPLDISDWKACIRAIRQSKGRDSIAKNVMEVLRHGFDDGLAAGVLLMAKEDIALGWSGFSHNHENVDVDALAVGLDIASIFAAPYATQEPFFGKPEEPSVSDKRFWRFLGAEPVELAVLPIVVLGDVACLLYVHSESPIPADKVGSLGDIARAISAALTRLIRASQR